MYLRYHYDDLPMSDFYGHQMKIDLKELWHRGIDRKLRLRSVSTDVPDPMILGVEVAQGLGEMAWKGSSDTHQHSHAMHQMETTGQVTGADVACRCVDVIERPHCTDSMDSCQHSCFERVE